ncbi:hypothetical protein Lal_00017774 [Lupinus albus]|uniref:Uncharacterized protein n=1 Tax=Lupinus albus TaxID=3870 RepID=A0A6A5MDQ0_LUPAL|nr:hypothetical protein Lalb_Chr04g0258981 [Lupinus albus]KAF1870193.1 hypothetical protein Lal_00017774 [Lupinus albus]
MNTLFLLSEYPTFKPSFDLKHFHATFFKCISWEVEETFDAINCPYHYVCDRTYPSNYSPVIDILVLFFTTASYLVTLIIFIKDMSSRRGRIFVCQSKRYFLPSGPISLPLIILTFAKGPQINTIFPLSCVGPAILHLVLISALSFDNGADKDIKYVFVATSTVSGILHASLYLDFVLLPYYTGFDALMSSTFSGQCASCVCRNEPLVVGGKLVSYRGWSMTTFLVVGVLCLRIVCKVLGVNSGKVLYIKNLMEKSSWILITVDSVYLTANSPPERLMLRVAAFGGIFLLIFLHVLKEAWVQICTMAYVAEKLRWASTSLQPINNDPIHETPT